MKGPKKWMGEGSQDRGAQAGGGGWEKVVGNGCDAEMAQLLCTPVLNRISIQLPFTLVYLVCFCFCFFLTFDLWPQS